MKPLNIDRSKLEQMSERATKFHRLQMAHRAMPLKLNYEIRGVSASASTVIVQPDVWAPAGHVSDEVDLWDLAVWGNPTTDPVKLEKLQS